MSVTVENILIRALALIDELTTTGTRDTTKTADYAGKTPALVNMYQKELLRTSDLCDIYEVARKPINNELGEGFTYEEYLATESIYEANKPAYAYYFESDSNSGVAYIEDYNGGWNTLATVVMSNTTDGFIAYKGRVPPTAGATKSRIRFTGSYYYRTVNRALFNVPFESGKNPDYGAYVKITLPTDTKYIESVKLEYENKQYSNDDMYKIERNGNLQYLYVAYEFEGKIRVEYKPIPTAITSLTDNLQIDDMTADLIAYKLASTFMLSEQNIDACDRLKNDYDNLKREANRKQPIGATEIVDYYGVKGG
jgi:hypothetical protein